MMLSGTIHIRVNGEPAWIDTMLATMTHSVLSGVDKGEYTRRDGSFLRWTAHLDAKKEHKWKDV